jgi:hypothetical protein
MGRERSEAAGTKGTMEKLRESQGDDIKKVLYILLGNRKSL